MIRRKPEGPLRKGWTTGACATAAASAAYRALLSGRFAESVTIALPRGEKPTFALSRAELDAPGATAGVIKDAGDDPDVTHGAEIVVRVEIASLGGGVQFRAGEGVGTATLPGLPIAVGEAAINPAPRRMMEHAIAALAKEFSAPGEVILTISIPGGGELAKRTMNGRLGILGGLSVLGTTGVVLPYSCSAWVYAIRGGIDVARASGFDHIAAATGATSEAGARALHGLAEAACIEMGDFAGALLKYLAKHPVKRLTIAGGFAKLSKLAGGHLDLHSDRSEVDFANLAAMLRELGAAEELAARAGRANTANQVLEMARGHGLPLAGLVAERARETALATLAGGVRVDVAVFDRAGGLVGHGGG